jgi:hypothetical protein
MIDVPSRIWTKEIVPDNYLVPVRFDKWFDGESFLFTYSDVTSRIDGKVYDV